MKTSSMRKNHHRCSQDEIILSNTNIGMWVHSFCVFLIFEAVKHIKKVNAQGETPLTFDLSTSNTSCFGLNLQKVNMLDFCYNSPSEVMKTLNPSSAVIDRGVRVSLWPLSMKTMSSSSHGECRLTLIHDEAELLDRRQVPTDSVDPVSLQTWTTTTTTTLWGVMETTKQHNPLPSLETADSFPWSGRLTVCPPGGKRRRGFIVFNVRKLKVKGRPWIWLNYI